MARSLGPAVEFRMNASSSSSPCVGIVIVVYRSLDRIGPYVRNDLAACAMPCKIVVVDVGSPLENAQRIAKELGVAVCDSEQPPVGNLAVLSVAENLGYARGNNVGVRYLLRHFPHIDRLLFSNDDISFLSPKVIETLSQTMDENPSIGMIGPDVVDLQGNFQGPLYRHPSIWKIMANNILEPLLGRTRANALLGEPSRPRESGPCSIVSGCFMMARAADFMAAGMFDERTFLFWEEEIMSRRMEAIGKRFYFESAVRIRHWVGATLSQNAPNLLLVRNMLAGENLYFTYYERHNIIALILLRLSNALRMGLVRLAILKRVVLRR